MSGTVHATAVLLQAGGLLLRGASGAGKSSLAMRLIDRGAMLVADDRVCLSARDGVLYAAPPPVLAGLIEVRGLGILRLPYAPLAAIRLMLDLGGGAERMPEEAEEAILGISVPVRRFDAGGRHAAIGAEWAVAQAVRNRLW